MAALIIILVLAFIGVLIAALMAGGSEKRKNALLWSGGGVVLSLFTGATIFFCKSAITLPSHTSLKLSFLSSCLSLR